MKITSDEEVVFKGKLFEIVQLKVSDKTFEIARRAPVSD